MWHAKKNTLMWQAKKTALFIYVTYTYDSIHIWDMWKVIHYSTLQYEFINICDMPKATHCITLQHTATHCNTLQHTATWLYSNMWHAINSKTIRAMLTVSVLQRVATCCTVLQCVAMSCSPSKNFEGHTSSRCEATWLARLECSLRVSMTHRHLLWVTM